MFFKSLTSAALLLSVLMASAQAAPQVSSRGVLETHFGQPLWHNQQVLIPQQNQISSWEPNHQQWLNFSNLTDCQPTASLALAQSYIMICLLYTSPSPRD